MATQIRRQRHLPDTLQDDMVAEGLLGLVKGIRRYNPHKGAKLSTFVFYWIRGEILEFLRKNDYLPRSVREKAKREGRALPPSPLSLQTPLGGTEGKERRLQDVLPDTNSLPMEEHGWAMLAQHTQSAALRKALLALPARQQQVLAGLYGQELGRSQNWRATWALVRAVSLNCGKRRLRNYGSYSTRRCLKGYEFSCENQNRRMVIQMPCLYIIYSTDDLYPEYRTFWQPGPQLNTEPST